MIYIENDSMALSSYHLRSLSVEAVPYCHESNLITLDSSGYATMPAVLVGQHSASAVLVYRDIDRGGGWLTMRCQRHEGSGGGV